LKAHKVHVQRERRNKTSQSLETAALSFQ